MISIISTDFARSGDSFSAVLPVVNMDFYDDISPMDELLDKHFPEDRGTTDWLQNGHSEGELTSDDEYLDLENILSQTRLNPIDFDASSTISSEPQSPQVLQVSTGQFSDDELVHLPIRELNKRLRNLPKEEAQKVRKRRRSLKNRGYATSCRQRRVALKDCLESQNQRLKEQLRQMKEMLNIAVKERDTYKAKCEQLREIIVAFKRSKSS